MGRCAQSVPDFGGADTTVLDAVYVLSTHGHGSTAKKMTLRLGADAWRIDGCNIALMSYAGSSALGVASNNTAGVDELSRVGATSWKQVFDAVLALMDHCPFKFDAGGAAIVESCEPSSLCP